MKLEDIGFYTLSDYRVKQSNIHSLLWRCELILTNRCNFRCTYCRGVGEEISFKQAMYTLELWVKEGLKNVRFSGGEPTLYNQLKELVIYCKNNGVERIAVSTNGSSDLELYRELKECGVNDFSISLDSCCASEADGISGCNGSWDNVCNNIREISKFSYVTIGVVINEENIDNCLNTIKLGYELGVQDIRIIPSAQYNKLLGQLGKVPKYISDKYPILNYRINNTVQGRGSRGLKREDSCRCGLVLDDIAVMGDNHYPCIIYMREGGRPIGKVGLDMRKERLEWMKTHDTHKDSICSTNCLDVCIDYNNRHDEYNKDQN